MNSISKTNISVCCSSPVKINNIWNDWGPNAIRMYICQECKQTCQIKPKTLKIKENYKMSDEITDMHKEKDESKNEKDILIKFIKQKEKEGKIVFNSMEGLQEIKLKDFIKQPTEGILYDLNRDKMTVLTFIENEKWVNDYAVGLVIEELKKHYDKNNLKDE